MNHRGRAATFLVRAWWDEGRFYARIRYNSDLDQGRAGDVQVVTVESDEIQRQLASWLTTIAGQHDD